MPSAANAKSEKPASSEPVDNSPVRQVMTLIEHKIRNLEKRKSKLTSYRDLQKSGKDLNSDQKIAVAKYDEVAQTLEFARDMSKQIASIVATAEKEAKKQAKKDAWIRYAADVSKIKEVLLILDCLFQMGTAEIREDFLNGTNNAAKLKEEDLKVLDDLYPEVTPKHELNEEGQPGFQMQMSKAAEHLYAIIDGKQKEAFGTTYAHIKEIITVVQECGYFDKSVEKVETKVEETQECEPEAEQEPQEEIMEPNVIPAYPEPAALPIPPAPAVVPAPAYPLRPMPPVTLQEVEHAYFSQQYPQQRQISEVIGSQNFFFLQESEIDSPVGTPQPPPILNQPSPPAHIPTQTFMNQHFVQIQGTCVPEGPPLQLPPQPLYAPQPDHAGFVPVQVQPQPPLVQSQLPIQSQSVPPAHSHPVPHSAPVTSEHVETPQPQQAQPAQQYYQNEELKTSPPPVESDDWQETVSPERDETLDQKTQGNNDSQGRFRRYGRGDGRSRPNGYRGRGGYQGRSNGRPGEYQSRSNKDGYQGRQYGEVHQNRQNQNRDRMNDRDGYYGNGDASDSHQENGGRDRYSENRDGYQSGYKGRGRGGTRGARGGPRPPRTQQYSRKHENTD